MAEKPKLWYPFFLPTILGQGVVNSNFNPIGKLQIVWNYIFLLIYCIIFLYTLYSGEIENHQVNKRYSFISQIKYNCNLYGSTVLMILIRLKLFANRSDMAYCIQQLSKLINEELPNLALSSSTQLRGITITMFVTVLMVFSQIMLDAYQLQRELSVCMWIVLYLPGLSNILFFMNYITTSRTCTSIFCAINKKLKEFTYPDLLYSEIYILRKKQVKPFDLLKKLPNSQVNLLDKLFMIHDEACDIKEILATTSGLLIFLFFSLSSISILSFTYSLIQDILANELPGISTITCNFWVFVNFIVANIFMMVSIQVDDNGSETLEVLHKLVNIYPYLEQYVEVYALQLAHQNTKISAAGFFSIDRSIIAGLLKNWVTYLIILLQLSKSF